MILISKPVFGEKEINAVKEVLESGFVVQGEKVKEFEEKFAKYIGVKQAIAINSGTSALHTALASLEIGKGDEVITTTFSFIATASCILMQNAKPVFVDINEKTYNIDPAQIEDKITERTKAIIPVHLYGQPCDMDVIMRIARKHDLYVIEDAAQAHGAEYKGKKVGAFGDIGVFSFYATKNMTTGEGGMITTNSEEIAEKARPVRNHGQKQRYIHEVLGYNYRMTDIAATIGICQLKNLDQFNAKRIENAGLLTEGIKKVKGLILPYVESNIKHVFHQYTIRVTEDFNMSRDELKQKLTEKGMGTGIYYPIPIHKQPLFKKYNKLNLKNAEKASKEVISIPVHPSLRKEDIEYIVEALIAAKEEKN